MPADKYVPTRLGDIKRYKGYLPQKVLASRTVKFLEGLIGDGWLDDVIWPRNGIYVMRYRFGEIMECQLYCNRYRWRGIPLKVWMDAMSMDRKALDKEDWEWVKEQRRLLADGKFKSTRLPDEEFMELRRERMERLSAENPPDSMLNPEYSLGRMERKRRLKRLIQCAEARGRGLPPPPSQKRGSAKKKAADTPRPETHAPDKAAAADAPARERPARRVRQSSGGLLDV